MMPRKVSMCHVCLYSTTLAKLKTSVTEAQAQLRVGWMSSSIIQLDEHLLPHEPTGLKDGELDWFLLNEHDKPTVIPSYAISNRAWERAFFINPLEVDWMRFEVHDMMDLDYLVSAVEVLQDMQDLWQNDDDTRGQAIMRLFIFFTRTLKRLLMYTSSSLA
jgi:hypothetical protein